MRTGHTLHHASFNGRRNRVTETNVSRAQRRASASCRLGPRGDRVDPNRVLCRVGERGHWNGELLFSSACSCPLVVGRHHMLGCHSLFDTFMPLSFSFVHSTCLRITLRVFGTCLHRFISIWNMIPHVFFTHACNILTTLH